ncbi:MAG: transcription termination factor Rho [Planctomycetes bacterium]|nr:transcription termination factor Rho [Planctomycetota bacterium]
MASEPSDPNDSNTSWSGPSRAKRPAPARPPAADAFGAGLDLDRAGEARTRQAASQGERPRRRERAPEPPREPQREARREPQQREPQQDAPRERPREPRRDSQREQPREPQREALREPQREAPREPQAERPAPARPVDELSNGAHPAGDDPNDWRAPERRRGSGRRGGRRRRRGRGGDGQGGGQPQQGQGQPGRPEGNAAPREPALDADEDSGAQATAQAPVRNEVQTSEPIPREGGGILVKEMGGFGTLRVQEANYLPGRSDIFVPERLIQQHRLREGSLVEGRLGRGQKHKYALNDVLRVDGKPPAEVRNLPEFRTLTSIDPDFHYAVGDITDEVSMRIIDLLCPIGRGQRGLIVAPPRSGKTTILRQFARGIEEGFPEVQLMVLLVDERPEEATEWKRSIKGHVYCSTSDESPRSHVQIAEFVWKRAMRLVELGQDVVLLLDSITRLARAYNNLGGGSGKTMSGGLDSKAMERPRQFFGSARNTETAGSLTILGTTLVDTGSRMDQLIFEEFKGTGNMELVLSRKLADRRIFPAIDIEKSGTRKEEKLLSSKKLKSVQVLRRVLTRMHFAEAMDLLITKLQDVEKTDDFLKRFEVDPEA